MPDATCRGSAGRACVPKESASASRDLSAWSASPRRPATRASEPAPHRRAATSTYEACTASLLFSYGVGHVVLRARHPDVFAVFSRCKKSGTDRNLVARFALDEGL